MTTPRNRLRSAAFMVGFKLTVALIFAVTAAGATAALALVTRLAVLVAYHPAPPFDFARWTATAVTLAVLAALAGLCTKPGAQALANANRREP